MALNLVRLFSFVVSITTMSPVAAEPISEKHQACVDQLITTELSLNTIHASVSGKLNVTVAEEGYKYDLSKCLIYKCHTVSFFAKDEKNQHFSGYAEVQFKKDSCNFYSNVPSGQVSNSSSRHQSNSNLVILDRAGHRVLELSKGTHNLRQVEM